MARGACGYIQAIPMVMHSFHACVYFVVGFSFHWSHMTVHASRFTALRLLVQSLNHTNKKHHQITFWPFVWGIDWWQVDLPAQMASDAESISISWRHYGLALCCFVVIWYRSISPMSFSVTSLSDCGYTPLPVKQSWHDDVIKWKHFPRYWPFELGIHRSRVNSPHKGQWRGALMFSLICVWINGWVNNGEATAPIMTSL